MNNIQDNRPVVATYTDYALGKHYAWEVAAHEAENEFFKKTGQYWPYELRKTWISRYFSITPYHAQYRVMDCPVCVPAIAQATLEGRNPFAPGNGIKEELQRLNRKIGGVLGVRRRHIDEF